MQTVHDSQDGHNEEATFAELHSLGARLVLCTKSKRATEKAWQSKRPDPHLAAGALSGGGLVGIVPGTVDLVAIDIDRGGQTGRDAVIDLLGEPLATVLTRTEAHWHLYYRAPDGEIGNRQWQLGDAGGEIRGTRGYAILWDPEAVLQAATRAPAAEPVELSRLPAKPAPRATRGAEAVRTAEKGSRNDVLNREAFALARRDQLNATAESDLRQAATAVGLEPAETDRTLRSARESGEQARIAAAPPPDPAGEEPARESSDLADAETEGDFARAWSGLYSHEAFLYAEDAGWLAYERGLWTPGEVKARETLIRLVRKATAGKGVKERRPSDRHSTVTGALAMAQYQPASRTVAASEFDASPHLVAFPDGTVLDVDTWTRRPATPRDRIRTALAVTPADAPSERWQKFVLEALAHYGEADRQAVADFLQEWCGVALIGDCRDECIAFPWGDAGSGKSTFYETLQRVAGETGAQVSGERVAGDRSDHRQWLAGLAGRRLVVINELPEHGRWNTADLNALADGSPIEANRMRQDSFTFRSHASIMLVGNHRPRASYASGFWRRLALIEFRNKPAKPDPLLKATLASELGGVLAWQLEGLQRWHERGQLAAKPTVVAAATASYRDAADDMGRYLSERTISDPAAEVKTSVLYADLEAWWNDEGGVAKTPSKRAFGLKLDDMGYPAGRQAGPGTRLRLGLKLKTQL